jgi:hypothetical protein
MTSRPSHTRILYINEGGGRTLEGVPAGRESRFMLLFWRGFDVRDTLNRPSDFCAFLNPADLKFLAVAAPRTMGHVAYISVGHNRHLSQFVRRSLLYWVYATVWGLGANSRLKWVLVRK